MGLVRATDDSCNNAAIPIAVDVEIQHRVGELRRELLDDRAAYIDRWLSVIALVLTFFGIVAVVGGYIGFRQFQEIKTEAKNSASAASAHAEEAKRHVQETESNRDKSDKIIRRMNAEIAVNDPNTKQTVKDVLENPKASLINKAIANALGLQQQGRNKEAMEKWRAIAHIAKEGDDNLAARAWFSVGYLLQDEDLKGSLSAYDQAIRLKPDSAAYSNRGVAKATLGNTMPPSPTISRQSA